MTDLRAPHSTSPSRALLHIVRARLLLPSPSLLAAAGLALKETSALRGHAVASDACACRAASCNGTRLRRPSTALAMALPSARMAFAFRCALDSLIAWQRDALSRCALLHPMCTICLSARKVVSMASSKCLLAPAYAALCHSGPLTLAGPVLDCELRCAFAGPCKGRPRSC